MKTLTRFLLLAPLLLSGGGCIDNKATIEMFSICLPAAGDACKFAAKCDAQYIGQNYLDISLAQHLWLFVEVHNQLLPNDDPGTGRVNTNDAFIQDVLVSFRGLTLPSTRNKLQTVVPANGTAVISIFPMTEETVAALGLLLGDGTTWETASYEIPVRVCDGCLGGPFGCPTLGDQLVTCPPDSNGTQLPVQYACVTP
jgi:hypothetical protein